MLTIAIIISIMSAFFISRADIKKRLIPDVWLWPLLLCGLFLHGQDSQNVLAAIVGYALGYILMMAMHKKDALGYGDVKLLSVAGLWLGIKGLSISVVAACIFGIIWGLTRKEKYIPFAPFLFAGTAVYFLIKESLWLI